MRTVEEINAQIAVHKDNIEGLKEQIDTLGMDAGDDQASEIAELEEEISEERGEIRELEAERDAL
jgi:uncharacterized coiled-coil protein SlyX